MAAAVSNMSDGGEENNVDFRYSKKKRSGIDDFTLSVAKVAVAQICEAAGFQGFQRTALDTLSDVAVRFIRDVGRTANLYSNLACRSQCNVFDIIQGLEDLGSVQGFSGASDVHHCLSNSGTVRELVRYVRDAEEIPFAYSVPGFPIVKQREPHQSFEQTGVSPRSEHVPSWLPAFPDPETYVDLLLVNGKAQEAREDEVGQVNKNREADRPMSNLPQKMTCNGSASSVAADFRDAAKGKRTVECNPFLAPPLQPGEKKVSLVLPPAKLSDEAFVQSSNHAGLDGPISSAEAFASAIQAVKSGPFDSEDARTAVPLNRKTNVQFKFGGGRKSLHKDVSSQNQEIEKIASWFSDDDEKDDNKSRGEQILRQSYKSAGTDSIVN